MAVLIGESVRPFCAGGVTALLKEHPEIECTVWFAALLGTAVGGLGALDVAAALKQHAKVYRRSRMPPGVRGPVGLFGRNQIAALLHEDAKVEPADGVWALIHRPKRAPRHSPQALRFAER